MWQKRPTEALEVKSTMFKMIDLVTRSVKPLVKQLGGSGFRLLKQWWFDF